MLEKLVLAVVTPFNQNQAVDYESTGKLLDIWRKAGISQFFVCGTTGEMLGLTLDERKEVAEYYLKNKKSTETICVHIGGVGIDEVIELGKHAFANGADSVSIVTPHYYKISQNAIADFYRQAIRGISADKDIYLYNIPQCTGNDLSVECFSELINEFPNVKGLKYSFFDPNRTQSYILASDNKCNVLSGTDHMAVALVPLGVKGIVTGAASVYPEVFAKYLDMVFAGKEVPLEFQQLVTEVVDILGYGNMSIFKAILNRKGLCKNIVRSPLVQLTPKEETELFTKVDSFESRVKKYLD
ncbi:MAG: hypothetical protein ATN35_00085 [Epulopiscium sp. Nele67-Bin004]|nr:MAG: hypothetical protein ATN35_00085 [Epulopiscium sp. Nele67-Bin004]